MLILLHDKSRENLKSFYINLDKHNKICSLSCAQVCALQAFSSDAYKHYVSY
jgi:hypothetical protein